MRFLHYETSGWSYIVREIINKNEEKDRPKDRSLWDSGQIWDCVWRFGYLKVRVENVQTAMSWSTYEWILVSHNSLVCIITFCVEPCQRPWRSSLQLYMFVYVHDQQNQGYLQYRVQTNWTSCVSQDLWLRNPCWQSARILSEARCLFIFLTIKCSRFEQHLHVSLT